MTGADPGALHRAAAAGVPLQELTASTGAVVAEQRDLVRARCGLRAVVAAGLEDLLYVAAHAAETDRFVSGIRAALVAADTASWPQAPGPDPTATTPPGLTNGGRLTFVDGLIVADGTSAVGSGRPAGASAVPWLDPETDSWVVGIGRALSGSRPSPAFIRRILDDGPAVVEAITDPELSVLQQATTLLTDPGRFVDDWRRAGGGALDAAVALGLSAVGMAAVISPGADDTAERLVGRRYGAETQRSIIDSVRLVTTDPDTAAATGIGLEAYRDDPYRWLGSMLPDALLEAVTTALPMSAMSRAHRLDPPLGRTVPISPHRPPSGSPPPPASGPPAPPSPLPDLDSVRRLEPEWGPAEEITSHRQRPFEPPESWAADLNGDGHTAPGRNNNCVDCARAAEANWRGQDAVAAPLADTHRTGVSVDRIEEWAGGRLVPATIEEIADELTDLGPGSSAIVASGWGSGGAHAYNAVNDGGVVKWVDAQLGRTSTWPPPYADEVDVSLVLYLDREGRPR
ncbi:MAG: toxin glutamine deamidase domain-containing protein [Acidimicrobiia bacterium]|nr:toxin glutamine deamidase domain-containing protein [Acidimicrobiia bacterium]